MEANQLRIGNWVETYTVMMAGSWIDNKGKVHGKDVITEPAIRQKQIDVKDLKIISESGGLATYRGIPLTPDILEKCGFVKGADNKWRVWGNDSHYLYGSSLFYAPDVVPEIKHLHQLQNLYFSLTGVDLVVNL